MSDLKFKPLEELSYEEALKELEELVKTLESGENELKTTLLYFERGQSWHPTAYRYWMKLRPK